MSYIYRGPHSPRDEQTQYSSFSTNPLSPQRNPNRLSGGMMSSNDARGPLTRRFTTNALPSLSPIGQQRRQAAGDTHMTSGGYNRASTADRKIRHYANLLEESRRIAAELEGLDDETRRDIEENLRHQQAVDQMTAQSEPTTPPELQDTFNKSMSRPNRYSTTSMTSPLTFNNRPNRSSTQLTSPPFSAARPYTAVTTSNLPSQSVPGSRRQSDDEEDEDDFVYGGFDSSIHRAAKNPNRNSMPVTSYDRKLKGSSFGPVNTTSFLFDENDKPSALPNKSTAKASPPDMKTVLQMQHTADGFPQLIRLEDNGELVPASPSNIDPAFIQGTAPEQQATDRTTATRHRVSLPPTALSSNGNIAPLNSILANANDAKSAANNRRSLEVKFTAETKRPALMASPSRGVANGTAKSQASYSTNDIPTLKSINGEGQGGASAASSSTQVVSAAEAKSPEKQTSGPMSRVASNSAANGFPTNRQSQDFNTARSQDSGFESFPSQNNLQVSSNPFGSMPSHEQNQIPSFPAQNMNGFGYNGYPMPMNMLNNGFANMNLNGNGYGGQPAFPNQMAQFQPGFGFGGYQQFAPNGPVGPGAGRPDSQRTAVQRKMQADELYHNAKIADLQGQIFTLCKDQHGCRFLQRKIEELNEQDIQMIFEEVKDRFTELTVDPFGNYLCQRLFDYANEEQRTALVANAAPNLTRIALNQHGTRALQRMIEQITTPEQIELITYGLNEDVVSLIQDLNGNHVVQKCLNHLSSGDSQFIFEAVGASCVIVGTHRHGCCVLQRCIDHASEEQKGALIGAIINNAFPLVQDPFGNYVVQYILDLSEPAFTEPLCQSFLGNIAHLSKQKFSSNVIEKAVRCAGPETKRLMIFEINSSMLLDTLLRDSYANYVVQTCLDFADDETKPAFIDNLRPILPHVRNTPYGRRIATKIQDFDNNIPGTFATGHTSRPQSNRANRSGIVGPPSAWPGQINGYSGGNMASPTPQRNLDFNFINGAQNYPVYPNAQNGVYQGYVNGPNQGFAGGLGFSNVNGGHF